MSVDSERSHVALSGSKPRRGAPLPRPNKRTTSATTIAPSMFMSLPAKLGRGFQQFVQRLGVVESHPRGVCRGVVENRDAAPVAAWSRSRMPANATPLVPGP
jgi:hypothetical protein